MNIENTTGRMGVGVISAGKVGTALGSALRAAGHTVVGAHAASEASRERLDAMLPGVPALDVETIVERAELVILAVPDAELAGLVSGLAKLGTWQAGQIVVHTAARFGVEVLAPAAQAGALTLAIHPAMEFTGTSLDVARLAECRFAVSAPTVLQPIGLALVAEMGGEGVVINSADRPLYDAALAHAVAGIQLAAAGAARVLGIVTGGQLEGDSDAVARPDAPVPGDLLRSFAQSALERGLAGRAEVPDDAAASRHLEALTTLAAESAEVTDVAQAHAAILDVIGRAAQKPDAECG
ncbi:Rossmann-like and DUF2520 domain-containing protein [Trueperella bialowiezensis]|uniref:Panthothenate synthetase n=1 Tax=Trueperella bialowiezensis TaxID=312285 RepID=A0A3S4Z5W4_9ACTO|nr:NAD(P)-binding domain-containing protein [Trueperella bialowiezensis]VEI13663.1 Panthothenate synthetase [Trueperella bialowiezensis]